MSTFTTTGTMPRHMGFPLFSRIPPEQTFWGSLSEQEKKECVSMTGTSIPIGLRIGFELGGEARKHWELELGPRLQCIRINRKKDILGNKEQSILLHPFMLGTTMLDAKPTVVMNCYDGRTLQRLGKLIKRDDKFQLSGFEIVAWQGCFFKQKAGGAHVRSLTVEYQKGGLFRGARIKTRSALGVSRTAIVGGLVLIQDEVFGLTAAHTFDTAWFREDQLDQPSVSTTEGFEIDLNSDDDSSSLPDAESEPKLYFQNRIPGASSEKGPQEQSRTTRKLESSGVFLMDRDQKLGTFIDHPRLHLRQGMVSERPHASVSLDWALVTMDANALKDIDLDISKAYINELSMETRKLPPRGAVRVELHDEHRSAIGTGVTSVVCLPGSDAFVRAYSIYYSSDDGECGAWVWNASFSETYGVIVGESGAFGLTYMIPMEDIVADIEEKWAPDSGSPSTISEGKRTEDLKRQAKDDNTYKGIDDWGHVGFSETDDTYKEIDELAHLDLSITDDTEIDPFISNEIDAYDFGMFYSPATELLGREHAASTSAWTASSLPIRTCSVPSLPGYIFQAEGSVQEADEIQQRTPRQEETERYWKATG